MRFGSKTKSPRSFRGQNGGFGFWKKDALSAAGIAAVCAAAVAGIAVIVAGIAVAAVRRCSRDIAGNAVRGTEYRAKPAAGFRCGGGGEHIHRETDIFKIRARVAGAADSRAGFRQASAKGIDHHIDCAVQFYDAEQAQCDIDRYRRTQCRIAAATVIAAAAAAASTAASAVAGATGRVSQISRQCDCFAFRNNERPAAGIAAAVEEVSCGSNFGFGGAEQRYAQVICVCSFDTADCAPIRRQGCRVTLR